MDTVCTGNGRMDGRVASVFSVSSVVKIYSFIKGNLWNHRILRCASLECAHLSIGQTHRSATTFSHDALFTGFAEVV